MHLLDGNSVSPQSESSGGRKEDQHMDTPPARDMITALSLATCVTRACVEEHS